MNEVPHLMALDAIVDKVLGYRPKPKSLAGQARKRKTAKIKRVSKRGKRE